MILEIINNVIVGILTIFMGIVVYEQYKEQTAIYNEKKKNLKP